MNHLTPAQLAAYHRDGFAACPGFFSDDDVAVMRGELDHLVEAGLLRNVHTENDGSTHSKKAFNLQICPLSPKSPTLRTLPFADKVVTKISALLGSDFYLRLDQIFLKPARHGVGFASAGRRRDRSALVRSRSLANVERVTCSISPCLLRGNVSTKQRHFPLYL